MSANEQKYIKDKKLSDSVTRTKTAHGKIETAIRVRNAKTKNELDLETIRLKLLKEIESSTKGENIRLPIEFKKFQQIIILVGTFNLKTTTELMLLCKKFNYQGNISEGAMKSIMVDHHKDLFFYDKEKGWQLTSKGQTEFSRLKQLI